MAHKDLGQKTLSNLMKDCETWCEHPCPLPLPSSLLPSIAFLADQLAIRDRRAKIDQRPMMEVRFAARPALPRNPPPAPAPPHTALRRR
jgi:hypothetical protein